MKLLIQIRKEKFNQCMIQLTKLGDTPENFVKRTAEGLDIKLIKLLNNILRKSQSIPVHGLL